MYLRFPKVLSLFDVLAQRKKFGLLRASFRYFYFTATISFILLFCVISIAVLLMAEEDRWTLSGLAGLGCVSLFIGLLVGLGTGWKMFLLGKYENWIQNKLGHPEKTKKGKM